MYIFYKVHFTLGSKYYCKITALLCNVTTKLENNFSVLTGEYCYAFVSPRPWNIVGAMGNHIVYLCNYTEVNNLKFKSSNIEVAV